MEKPLRIIAVDFDRDFPSGHPTVEQIGTQLEQRLAGLRYLGHIALETADPIRASGRGIIVFAAEHPPNDEPI